MARLSQSAVNAILAHQSSGAPIIPPVKRSKYGNKKTTVNGITFDSKREAARYSQLTLMELAGKIQNLQRQTKFPVYINSRLVFVYVADFEYLRDGQRVIEDVKGFKTSIYRLKKKAVEAYYNVKILETR